MTLPPLHPEVMIVAIAFPPRRLTQNDLNEIYVAVSRKSPNYNSMSHLPGYGIRIADPANNDIVIEENRVQIRAFVANVVVAKELIADLLKDISSRIQSLPYLLLSIKCITTVSLNRPNASLEFLNNKMLSLDNSTLAVLGATPDIKGVGTRFILNKNTPSKTIYELKIETFLADASKLYIELDVQFLDQFDNLDSLNQRIDHAHGFLKNEVKNFLVTAGVQA